MKFILNRLDKMLMDDIRSNKWSTNRVTFMFTVLLSNIVFWFILIMLTIIKKDIPQIPEELVYIYAMANGFSFVGKVVQRYSEVKEKISTDGVEIEKVKNGKFPKDNEESPEDTPPKPEE